MIGRCVALLMAGFLTAGACPAAHAVPLPTLVLYPRTLSRPNDIRALVDLRKTLRADGQFEVLTYDPASAAMIRAAADAHRPELLTAPMTADADRLSLSRALGAAFFVVVSRADGRGRVDIHLVESTPGARVWDGVGQKSEDAAHAIEQEASAALLHPVPAAATLPMAQVSGGGSALAVQKPKPVTVAPQPTAVVAPPVAETGKVVTPAAPPVPTVQTSPQPAKPTAPGAQATTTIIAPSSTPIPAPATVTVTAPIPAKPSPQMETAPSSTPITAPARAGSGPAVTVPPPDDLKGVKTQLDQGDGQLAQGNFISAIALYRAAINGAPLSVTPRLKLAQTYLQADMRDKALDEATRALEIAPGNAEIQQFLVQLDAQTGSSDGAVARFTAQVSENAHDPLAHVELGDAYWNNSSVKQAEAEYQTAQTLAPPGTAAGQTASAHLARLYAAEQRYPESLAALKGSGPGGYALALGIIQSRADTLSTTLEGAQDDFSAGKSTHADFYKTAGDVSAQAQTLADFVVQITPPAAFKLSHLYRIQATHLLAQQAAVLVSYIETSDASLADKAAQLGKEAQTEMLMAHAAEQHLGLWGGKQAEAKN